MPKITKVNGHDTEIMKAGLKTKGSGFKSGGAIKGVKMRAEPRARGGATGGSPFSSAHSKTSNRAGSSKSGHEGE